MDPRKPGKYTYDGLDICFLYEPFYIGSGKNYRYKDHLSNYELNNEKRIKHNRIKNIKIKNILSENLKPIIEILNNSIEEGFSREIEINLIDKIGRIVKKDGPLSNISDGGNGGNNMKYLDPERKKEIYKKLSNLFKSRKYDFRDGKEIHQYSVDGYYIKTFRSVSMASKVLKIHKYTILSCMKGKGYKSAGGFIFRDYKVDKIESTIIYPTKKVLQLDKNNNIIAEYNSATEASQKTGTRISGISSCCNGKYKHSNGFFWRYKE
jgi:hypothetical protein